MNGELIAPGAVLRRPEEMIETTTLAGRAQVLAGMVEVYGTAAHLSKQVQELAVAALAAGDHDVQEVALRLLRQTEGAQ